ncbi:hypothetical protein BH23BAC4_BH23BAC4_16500 [soil metagenome]
MRLAIAPESPENVQNRVTVVVPTLNEERILGALLGQLREVADPLGLHLVVSDGGSTDTTLDIARAQADQVMEHSGDRRQTIAQGRNAGAAGSRARVLLFLNADVTLPDRTADFLSDLILAAQEFGAATCRVAVHPDKRTLADSAVLGSCNFIFWAANAAGIGMGRGECHAIRRDVFEDVGGYNETLVAGEDFDLFKRITARNRRLRMPKPQFLWQWVIYEDPRRYRQQGYARTLFRWARNAAWVVFRGRAHSEEWEAVR